MTKLALVKSTLTTAMKAATAATFLLILGLRPGIAAADLARTADFHIAPQPLPAALLEYSEQAAVQVTSPSAILEGKSTAGVVGSYPARNALERLLAGTDLSYDVINPNTVSIRLTATSSGEARAHLESSLLGGPGANASFLRVAQADPSSNSQTSTDTVAVKHFEIKAKPLAQALMDFGVQSGLTVAAPTTLTAGKKGASVRGDLPPTDALGRLLKGSGLTYARAADGTIAIVSSSDPVQASAGESRLEKDFTERVELQEIVVTAQKRQERLKDVPISISVLEGRDLDRSTAEGISESLNRVPGVAISTSAQNGGSLVAVRGVSGTNTLFSGSSPIAYYLDSMPFGLVKSAGVPDSNAYDLERVEVLRGPQGTLYGASAQNGVVRILSKDADLEDFELKARASLSNTKDAQENYRGDLAVNVPLVEGKLAARAVVGYENFSGWIEKPSGSNVNDATLRNLRLKLNAQSSENLSLGFTAWLSRADYGAPSTADDNGFNPAPLNESIATDYDVYGIKVGYEFSGVSFSSMTSYLDYLNDGNLDFTPLGAPVILITDLDSRVFSQEILFNSKHGGPWRWSAGGIYRDAEDRLVQNIPADTDWNDLSKSFAVFGELTRAFLEGRLELTAGLRYFKDDVTQVENVPAGAPPPPDPPVRRSDTFDATTPRVVLSWHPSSDSTFYASYSEGFRSGFNQNPNVIRVAPDLGPVDADTLTNYELGIKGDVLAGRLSYDAALYYMDWQDVQQVLTVDVDGAPVTAVVNGESASGLGFDFGLTSEPVAGLELGLSFSWNNLEMDSTVRSFPAGAPPDGVILFDKGERNVSQIADQMRQRRGSASRRIIRERLEKLAEDGIVTVSTDSKQRRFSISDDVVQKWSQLLGLQKYEGQPSSVQGKKEGE